MNYSGKNKGTSMKKILESTMRVQYHDCDPFNHLNNSRYIDYMMAARTEQLLAHYGFDISEIARSQGIGWVSVQTQISYFVPASWMETVKIATRLLSYSDSSLEVEAVMWDENRSRIKAMMWAKLAHFNIQSQRSSMHTAELMSLFTSIHHPIEGDPTFEERARTLRSLPPPN